MFPQVTSDQVPISHVTDGVHLPTWMAPPMRALLTRYLGEDWERHVVDPATWAGVDAIPDEELWAVRCEQRNDLIAHIRRKVVVDRLARGEDLDMVQAGAEAFDPSFLTVGFARRLGPTNVSTCSYIRPLEPWSCSTTINRRSSSSPARPTLWTTRPRR